MSPVLLELAVRVRTCDSSAAPEEMPVRLMVNGAVSSRAAKFSIASSVGRLLTGRTLTTKLLETVALAPPPSLTVTVMVAAPVPDKGDKVRVAVVAGLV